MKRRMALIGMVSLALAACASMRGVQVGSDNGADTTRVTVDNRRSSSVQVSYEDNAGTHTLGSVAARDQQRFVVPMSNGSPTLVVKTSSGTVLNRYPLNGGTQTVVVQ